MKVSMIGSYSDPRIIKEANTLFKNGMKIDLILWNRGLSFSKKNISCNVIEFRYGKDYFDNWQMMVFLPFWWLFLIVQLLKNQQDVIHAANFDNYLICFFIAKIKRKKIIYEMFDFYGDTIIFPIFPKLIRKGIILLDRYFMNFADLIIIADKSRIKQIGDTKTDIVVINNSPNDITKKKNKFYKKKFTVFYGGQVSNQRGINQIILAAGNIPNVEIVIMGQCSSKIYKDELINMEKKFKNLKLCLETVPHEKIIDQTLKSDLLIALYDPKIPNNQYASPNKLFEAMMCGKPIVANKETSMAKIIIEENCGVIVPYNNIKSIKSSIMKIMNNSNLYNELGNNGRNAYESKYSWAIMEKKLLEAYYFDYK